MIKRADGNRSSTRATIKLGHSGSVQENARTDGPGEEGYVTKRCYEALAAVRRAATAITTRRLDLPSRPWRAPSRGRGCGP